jgi:hypothetical protein
MPSPANVHLIAQSADVLPNEAPTIPAAAGRKDICTNLTTIRMSLNAAGIIMGQRTLK